MQFLGLDIGTTSIKGAILDVESLAIHELTSVPFPDPVDGLPSGHCEVSPDGIIAAVRQVLDHLLAAAPQCQGVVACGQMHGFVLTDARGDAAANYISWKDQRALRKPAKSGSSYLETMCECLDRDDITRLGNELRAGLAVTGVYVLKETGQLAGVKVMPVPITDYVLSHFSRSPPSCDVTHAASLGGLNLETLTWHQPALGKLGLDAVQWPQIRRPGDVAYKLPTQRGMLPCYSPVGDHQCAVLGTQIIEGELSINVSTGAQVATLMKGCVPGDYQTRPYVDGRYLNTITHIPAGRALNMLVDVLMELPRHAGVSVGDPWPLIEQAVRAVTETDIKVDLSFYRSAVGVRGMLGNLSAENLHVGHIFRGAFESMAENFFACSQRLAASAFKRLVFSGGLVQKSAALRSIICERFQLPHRMGGTEETMLGLLTYALLASGRAGSFSEASQLLADA